MATLPRIAVAVIMALAAAMAAGCAASSSPATSGASSAASSGTPSGTGEPIPSFVPRDYVMIDPAGARRLIVRSTATGAVVATVSAPHGTQVVGVYGSDNDQVFAFGTMPVLPTPGGIWNWYVLRLRSGASPEITHLFWGRSDPTGVAVSPDGTKIAMAFTPRTVPPVPQPLTLYSLTTGAELRTWTVKSGIIAAANPMANGDLGQEAAGIAMRWTPDGRGLAFAFHAGAAPGRYGYGYNPVASIRLLDTSAPGSDLMAGSRELAAADFGYNLGNGAGTRCLAGSGWSVLGNGHGVSCAAEWTLPSESPSQPGQLPAGHQAGCPTPPATGEATPRQPLEAGFWRQYYESEGPVYGPCPVATSADIRLAWASPDGKTVLGAVGQPGHPVFGLFSGGNIRELPPPPANVPWASIAW
jgi:hypothetical protein